MAFPTKTSTGEQDHMIAYTNKAGYTAIRCVLAGTDSSFGQKSALLHGFNSCVMDGPTDGRTDGRTDGPTDGKKKLSNKSPFTSYSSSY